MSNRHANRNYNDAVKFLTASKRFRVSLGLERMEKILDLLGNPCDKLRCIHVAGTNGKGSVCAILASILKESGKKVGLYTSPHIFDYTERIQICSKPISYDDFSKYVFEISDLAEKHCIDLTEFEILTAVMFKYFADSNVDVVILETGLGGRYDATNVIKKNLCSIITHVDLDHTERLGDTIEKIAYEKAGIIKPNCPCIIYEGKEVYYDAAKNVNAPLELIVPCSDTSKLALKGVFQQENLSLALAAIDLCFPEITMVQIEEGLKKVKHPCRFQYIKDKNLIVDGAHNPNGINALLHSLELYYPNIQRRFVFGCLKNKDYKKMINSLFSKNDDIYFYHFSNANSASYDDLKEACPFECKELTNDTKIDFNDGKLTVICGSFYMIAQLSKLLNFDI